MIPKLIHYCWFGKGLMPQSQQDCIKGWKHLMPDYQFIRWDESNFSPDFCSYTSEAYKEKRYAFVADVARLKALFDYGGIYLDTDVELFSSLSPFLQNHLFSGIEIYREQFQREGIPLLDPDGRPLRPMQNIPFCGFLSAILGAEPKHTLIEQCLQDYMSRSGRLPDGSFNSIVIDGLLASYAVEHGFRYIDQEQSLPTLHLYSPEVFSYAGVPITANSIAYHHTAWSWMPRTKKQQLFLLLDKLHLLKPYRKLKKKILSK